MWLGLLRCVVFNGGLGFGFGSDQWCSCFVCFWDGVTLCCEMRCVVACCGVLCSLVFFVLLLFVARKVETIVLYFFGCGEHMLLHAGRCGWLWCVVFISFLFVFCRQTFGDKYVVFLEWGCAYVAR